MKGLVLAVVVTALLVGFWVSANADGKQILCHFDNGGVGHLVEVAASAVGSHLAHGDILDPSLYTTDGDLCWATQ